MTKNIRLSLYFVAILWIVHLIDFLPINLKNFGVTPRTFDGLWGIIFSPFLHANFLHLISNTVPIFVLLFVVLQFYGRIAYKVVGLAVLLGGSLLWTFGRSEMNGTALNHIGASGLIYSLIAFLIASGIFQKKIMAVVIAFVIFFTYGGVIWGVFPGKPWVSWDGHLFGAIAGILVAYGFRRKKGINK